MLTVLRLPLLFLLLLVLVLIGQSTFCCVAVAVDDKTVDIVVVESNGNPVQILTLHNLSQPRPFTN